jgi:glycosyltransferase involved in cell wall biosynthesis
MKVLFLLADEGMPSSRVRVLNLLPELTHAGIAAKTMLYPSAWKHKFELARLCGGYDATFLQKKLLSPLEALLLKRSSRKLVFDFDDAILFRHDSQELESWSRRCKFNWLLRHADLVIAGNSILAAHAAERSRRIVIIPSAVETRHVPRQMHTPAPFPVVIGWIGTSGNLHHLAMLSPVLQRLAKKCDIRLRVVCDQPIDVPGVSVEYVPWHLETQERDIARFDIGVMPLPKTRFSEGKCGYKALQYMAAAVPPVVSDVGVNREIVEHGQSGWVARTSEEFYEGLHTLVNDPEMRSNFGSRARERVEAHYSVLVVGKQLATELHRLCAE